jgi:hypothetical protein
VEGVEGVARLVCCLGNGVVRGRGVLTRVS